MGVDYGLKRTGLAVTDPDRRVAVGAGVLNGLKRRELMRTVMRKARERGARTVVIGLPDDGWRDNGLVRSGALRLGAALRGHGFEVIFHSESHTTSSVLRDHKIPGTRLPRQRGWLDEGAAILIVNDYLASLQLQGGAASNLTSHIPQVSPQQSPEIP